MSQNTRCDVRKCLLGSTRWPTTFWGSNSPQNRQKWPSISMFERPWTQDEWRHRRLTSLACSRSAAKWRILFIASWKLLQLCILRYLQRNDSVSWCTIFGTEMQFCKSYTVFVGNLFYRLAHKKIPYAVCWFDKQAADIRRTFWLCTNLGELT